MHETTVGIIGAGTMGAGIAQVAAAHGWTVWLRDLDETAVQRAIENIAGRFDRNVTKGRMTEDQREAAMLNLRIARSLDDLAPCRLIIEAIVEDLAVKTRVLGELLPVLAPEAIIATNTSSLSVTAIGSAINAGPRTVGMHFFNPAPLLKLVEVIAGDETDPALVDRTASIATSWGKVVARAADVPGFIVNHVARPYYLEAFRILSDGYATPEQIDGAMTGLGHFRMGPLALTDLIGQDVNTATSRSVWTQLECPPLLEPSALQESLAAEGRLGRKSGRGVYCYDTDPPEGDIKGTPAALELPDNTTAALNDFVTAAVDDATNAPVLDRYIFARILAGLIVQGDHAAARGVASPADIDTALENGTNYPSGPFAWRKRIGEDTVQRWLRALNDHTNSTRFTLKQA